MIRCRGALVGVIAFGEDAQDERDERGYAVPRNLFFVGTGLAAGMIDVESITVDPSNPRTSAWARAKATTPGGARYGSGIFESWRITGCERILFCGIG